MPVSRVDPFCCSRAMSPTAEVKYVRGPEVYFPGPFCINPITGRISSGGEAENPLEMIAVGNLLCARQ
jgi:hypothetical protein